MEILSLWPFHWHEFVGSQKDVNNQICQTIRADNLFIEMVQTRKMVQIRSIILSLFPSAEQICALIYKIFVCIIMK